MAEKTTLIVYIQLDLVFIVHAASSQFPLLIQHEIQ